MVIKVQDGTRGSKSLCASCHYSHIIKGSSDSQEIVYCARITGDSTLVPFQVVECNDYADKSTPALHDMRSVAWVLSTDKQKRFGFQSPKDWRKNREGDDGLDDINTDYPGAR